MIANRSIETCPKGSLSELDFATDLDKTLKFAIWQTAIFNQRETSARVTELGNALERKAFTTFQAHFTGMQRAYWAWVDGEAADPLKKVLQRLRAENPRFYQSRSRRRRRRRLYHPEKEKGTPTSPSCRGRVR